MAFGFIPKHSEEFPLNGLTQQQFMALAYETVLKLEWNIGHTSNSGLVAYTAYGAFEWSGEITIKVADGLATIRSESTGSDFADRGKNKEQVTKFVDCFEELKGTFTLEELDARFLEIEPFFVDEKEDMSIRKLSGGAENFLSFFIPRKDFFVTPLLVDLNLLVFILMVCTGVNFIAPDNQSLLNWGANFRSLTLEGQWWRLFTNCFLHIGIVHLLFNMYALVYIGLLLEPILGKTRFLIAYVSTGIVASVASLWWHDLVISAGASGAIFGMYGVFLALLTTDLIEKTARKTLLTSIGIFVGYNLLYGMKGGVDNAAHIGGLISGLAVGYVFIPSLKRPAERSIKMLTVVLLSFVTLIGTFTVYTTMPNDIGVFDAKMRDFAVLEQEALDVAAAIDTTPKAEIMTLLQNKGIANWNKCIRILESCEKLKLPGELKSRIRVIKEYSELRLQTYELFYRAISEDTDAYNAEINVYNQEVEGKLRELGAMQ